MAFRCDICGKGPVAGRSVSHSHRATLRRFLPNVHVVKAVVKGRVQRVKACTRCIRSEKVVKVGPRQLVAA